MAQKNIDLSKYTVLAVDDIPMNLLLISKILTRLNINVKTAANGREALDMIEKERPSLVLLDLMMPEIDGYEVLTRLRSNPATEDLRIIILSALNSNEDIVKGFNLGANDFSYVNFQHEFFDLRGIEFEKGYFKFLKKLCCTPSSACRSRKLIFMSRHKNGRPYFRTAISVILQFRFSSYPHRLSFSLPLTA